MWPKGHEKEGEPLFYRRFIPARLTDNPYLLADGQYEAMLRSLPEVERKRLLEGDWEVTEGAAFPEFSRSKHVTPSFELPPNFPRIRPLTMGMRVLLVSCGVLLTGITIYGFIVNCT